MCRKIMLNLNIYNKRSMVIPIMVFVTLAIIFLFLVAYYYNIKEDIAREEVLSYYSIDRMKLNEEMFVFHINKIFNECMQGNNPSSKEEVISRFKNELSYYRLENINYPYPLEEFVQIEKQLVESNVLIEKNKVEMNFEVIFENVELKENQNKNIYRKVKKIRLEKTI